jgi:AAA15 family ATPase/GTPase
MRHRAAEDPRGVAFPFNEESNGTKALFGLLGPIIHALATGGMLSIDELDSSLHPNLALELVRSFNDADRNANNAQLVFNTHDSNLLDREILGRDQIWFAEKDSGGATHIYPLSDFKPRRHESLGRGYLQGRYGAVPYIGSENFVAPDPDELVVSDAAS